jgi:MFS family permease
MKTSLSSATRFIILLGILSLFADMTYEGARSITGPFLAVLGANAATVGFVAGFGELVGYGLRMLSGYWADKTSRYWLIVSIGYACNLLVVPLLAFASHWWMAAALMIIERMGKAIRTPARDAMLSHAAHQTGLGWGFGLQEALDQTGAMLGPLMVAGVLYLNGSYQEGFALLLIPALLALSTLALARRLYPNPESLEIPNPELTPSGIKSQRFWIYVAGTACIAAGFADFPLIAYHFEKLHVFSPVWIPIAYSISMGASGLSALLLGHWLDKYGLIVLVVVSFVSAFFSPLVFLTAGDWVWLGIVLWSVGIGAQESLMRAIIASMIPSNKRASAYGLFNMIYGVFWFIGSVLMGVLYDWSILALVLFSVLIQLIAIPFLIIVMVRKA